MAPFCDMIARRYCAERGNFGLLGYANGMIAKITMQTGKERSVFGLDAPKRVRSSR